MPIVTELHGFNEDIIKEAIEYEISRDGQVFLSITGWKTYRICGQKSQGYVPI